MVLLFLGINAKMWPLGHGLEVGLAVLGQWLDLMTLKVFFNLTIL